MIRKETVVLLILLSAGYSSMAQTAPASARDTVIPASTIEIIQEYRPEVKAAEKALFKPVFPPADNERPVYQYEVPQQSLYYSYKSLPLRPLALGRDTMKLPFSNYVKLGYGNLSTLLADGGFAVKKDNYEIALHLFHLSQKGAIRYQESQKTNVNADVLVDGRKYEWNASLDITADRYYQYGYDHDLNPSFVPDRQSLNGGRLIIGARNKTDNDWGVRYSPSLEFAYFSGQHISGETTMGFKLPVTKDLDTAIQLSFTAEGKLTQLSFDTSKISNNIFVLSPGFNYHRNRWTARVFLSPAFGRGGNTYLLPDIMAGFRLPSWNMALTAGIKGSLQQNTYEQLFRRNPFISAFSITQTHSDQVYASVQKGLGNHLTLHGKVSWWQYDNLPMHLNEIASPQRMYVLYDSKVKAISLEAGARFQVGEQFSAGGSLTVYNFYEKTYSRIWHEPGLRFNGDISYKPLKGLTVTGYASYLDQIYAINISNEEEKLKAILDIGVGAEYQFLKRFSVFVTVNNLLDNKYQRWYGYEVYGLNFFGGLRVKF